jgi:cold shock CspA family protein
MPPNIDPRIHSRESALQQAGITGLSEGQCFFVRVAEDQKGLEAASIQLA